MGYSEQETFNKLTAELLPICEKIVEINRSTGGITYQKMIWDLDTITAKIGKKIEESQLIDKANEDKRRQCDSIIALANEEAKKIIEAARAVHLEAEQNLKTVKEFVTGIDKKKYNELKEKASVPA